MRTPFAINGIYSCMSIRRRCFLVRLAEEQKRCAGMISTLRRFGVAEIMRVQASNNRIDEDVKIPINVISDPA
jgi:hypothetical protein